MDVLVLQTLAKLHLYRGIDRSFLFVRVNSFKIPDWFRTSPLLVVMFRLPCVRSNLYRSREITFCVPP